MFQYVREQRIRDEEEVYEAGHDLFYGHVIGETVEDAPLMVERS